MGGTSTMDNSGLHGDEKILIRTAGVHVKSISFEATLTNKRIILVDRLKNILHPTEIPLATIQNIEAGENAIREAVITLTAITKNGRTRQMVLTFSRESGGGNRAKERNEWLLLLKEYISPSSDEAVPTGISGIGSAEKNGPVSPSKFKIAGSPLPQRPVARYEPGTDPQPVKKIVRTPPESWQAPASAPAPASESVLGTYCTRCGTRVPEGSGFCNTCGSRIIVPAEVPRVPVAIPTPAPSVPIVKREMQIYQEIPSEEKLMEHAYGTVPRDSLQAFPPEPAVEDTQPVAVPVAAQPQKRFMSRLFSQKEHPLPPRVPRSVPTAKPRSRKKLVLALVIVIIIAVVAVAVVLPKLGGIKSILPGSNTSVSSTTAPTPTVTVAHATTTVPTKQVTAATTPEIINQAASIVT